MSRDVHLTHVRTCEKGETRISTKQVCYVERIDCLVVGIERRLFTVEGRYRNAVRQNKCFFANYPPTDNVLKLEPSQPQEGAQDGFNVGSNGSLSEFARCLSQSHDARQPISSQGIGRFISWRQLQSLHFHMSNLFWRMLLESSFTHLASCDWRTVLCSIELASLT